MYKEVILESSIDENTKSHIYILVYDDTEQLRNFYKKLNITFGEEASFVYKSIDNNNIAYIIRTDNDVTESTLNSGVLLDKIYHIVNDEFFASRMLPENHHWAIGYIAKKLGININWNKPINEDELNKSAKKYWLSVVDSMKNRNYYTADDIINAYKAGRKSK